MTTLGRTSGIPRPKRGGRKLGRKAAIAATAVGLAALTACSSGSKGSGSTLSGISGGGYGSPPGVAAEFELPSLGMPAAGVRLGNAAALRLMRQDALAQ